MTTITAELKKDTEVTISNGRHTWHADEPPHVGGNDTGGDIAERHPVSSSASSPRPSWPYRSSCLSAARSARRCVVRSINCPTDIVTFCSSAVCPAPSIGRPDSCEPARAWDLAQLPFGNTRWPLWSGRAPPAPHPDCNGPVPAWAESPMLAGGE